MVPSFSSTIDPLWFNRDQNGNLSGQGSVGSTPDGLPIFQHLNFDNELLGYYVLGPDEDGGGPSGTGFGSYTQWYNPDGTQRGEATWSPSDRDRGWIGNNLDWLGPMAVLAAPALFGGLFGSLPGAGAASAGAGAGAATGYDAAVEQFLQGLEYGAPEYGSAGAETLFSNAADYFAQPLPYEDAISQFVNELEYGAPEYGSDAANEVFNNAAESFGQTPTPVGDQSGWPGSSEDIAKYDPVEENIRDWDEGGTGSPDAIPPGGDSPIKPPGSGDLDLPGAPKIETPKASDGLGLGGIAGLGLLALALSQMKGKSPTTNSVNYAMPQQSAPKLPTNYTVGWQPPNYWQT